MQHVHWHSLPRFRALSALAAAFVWFTVAFVPVQAAGPQDDVAKLNQVAIKALDAAKAGDVATAGKLYDDYDHGWGDIEDGVRDVSRQAYTQIEDEMRAVSQALRKQPVVAADLVAALQRLVDVDQKFVTQGAAGFPANLAPASNGPVTMASVIQLLETARGKVTSGDFAAAATTIRQAQNDWLDVEGVVKTRSADDYTKTEDEMALAATLINQKSAQAGDVLTRLAQRLDPYTTATSYGMMDAGLILLREGLEALLVVAALLAFLRRAGQADKQRWIWGGTAAGLAASVALALVMNLMFAAAMNAANRELIEGVTGLVAAGMLLYVSYWMHSKSSMKAWTSYIHQKGTAALASGSMWGLASLAFLAIFREGAETALFYMGIASSIATGDLLLGIVGATVLLVVIGALMIGVGVRMPIGPFMTGASILVFFLCFKFVGMGVHALQVANMLPASSATYLPSNGVLGMFPTWETTVPQLLLLAFALTVVVVGRLRSHTTEATPHPA